jgi:3',5'-cyclic AMP phosphodiesterase CpdA
MFRLAHLSDPHLPLALPLGRDGPRLTAKQRLAFLSWLRWRRHISTLAPDAALLADLASQAPDHIAVTGDLTNLGLKREYEAAGRWLERLGPAGSVSLVPGNHDATALSSWVAGGGEWAPWIAGDRMQDAPFPFLRRRGPVALIGLSSAVPTRIGSAAGRLGGAQIAAAARMLDQAAGDGLCRVVLIHHPPVPGPGGARKALQDRDALAAMLARHGAELVLHGHHHVTSRRLVPGPGAGPGGAIAVFGAPAALSVAARPEIAAWHLHEIERTGSGWRILTRSRRYAPRSDRFLTEALWETIAGDATAIRSVSQGDG